MIGAEEGLRKASSRGHLGTMKLHASVFYTYYSGVEYDTVNCCCLPPLGPLRHVDDEVLP